jgi:hypothetical protein
MFSLHLTIRFSQQPAVAIISHLQSEPCFHKRDVSVACSAPVLCDWRHTFDIIFNSLDRQ